MDQEKVEAVARKRRQSLSDHEAMLDAQSGCVPCKLCGGEAIISDAGRGAGYYIACSNSQSFREASGCLITLRRLGGWAYNVMDWWNRLHALPAPEPASEVAQEIIDSWIFNLELECSGASLNPLESVAIGGAVLRMDDLLSALKEFRSSRSAG